MNNTYHELGYVPVKEIISEEISQLFTQYAMIEELSNPEVEYGRDSDLTVKNTQSKYADSLTESLLLQLKPTMEYITGLELLPTYSYYRVYRPGSYLVMHTDRPSCEVSVSICFGYNYLQENGIKKWPLFFGETPVVLEPKDGVVYKGTEILHGRKELMAPHGSYHVQGFFHYVNKNGKFSNFALDSRNFIGEKKKKNPFKKSYLTTIF